MINRTKKEKLLIGVSNRINENNNYEVEYTNCPRKERKQTFNTIAQPYIETLDKQKKDIIKYIDTIYENTDKLIKYAILVIFLSILSVILISFNFFSINNFFIQLILAITPTSGTLVTGICLVKEVSTLVRKSKYKLALEIEETASKITRHNNSTKSDRFTATSTVEMVGINGKNMQGNRLSQYYVIKHQLEELYKVISHIDATDNIRPFEPRLKRNSR